MKQEILTNLDKLKSIDITVKQQRELIRETKAMVRRMEEPDTLNKKRTIEIDWLQKKIIDDMESMKCDGLVFEKFNHYIHLYEMGEDE